MAVNQTHKIEIRAVYESNNLSVKKVLERFPEVDVSPKTVESWVTKEKWIKNRFVNEKEAIEILIDDTLPLAEAKDIVAATLLNDKDNDTGETTDELNFMTPEQKRKYAGVVGKELAYKILHQHSMQEKMGINILRGEKIASASNNIGIVSTYHNMLVTTFKTLYGEIKHINPKSEGKIYTDEEIEKMSDEELEALTEL